MCRVPSVGQYERFRSTAAAAAAAAPEITPATGRPSAMGSFSANAAPDDTPARYRGSACGRDGRDASVSAYAENQVGQGRMQQRSCVPGCLCFAACHVSRTT